MTCTGRTTGYGVPAQNTCVINWGSANPNNYSVSYTLGTLLALH